MNVRLFLVMLAFTSLACGRAQAAYIVQKGDTLFTIARKNGTTVERLMQLNQLKSSTLEVGQRLQLSARSTAAKEPAKETKEVIPPPPAPPAAAPPSETSGVRAAPTPTPPARPATSSVSADRLTPTPSEVKIDGVNIAAPARVRMGDAFVISLSGKRAEQATVRFLSETREDVRFPNEALKPIGAAGEYRILGRAVLGKTTPLIYEVSLGSEAVRGRIEVENLIVRTQHLNLPPALSRTRQNPAAKSEEAMIEKLYTLRTPQLWSRPFSPPLERHASISSQFGQARIYSVGNDLEYHYGTDYPAPVGTPVQAINDGKVVVAGKYPVRGGLVVLDHGAGLLSMYFHLNKVSVKVGQTVTRGAVVGKVGSTGLSSGSHLHLELRVRGEAVDPLLWMNRLWPANRF